MATHVLPTNKAIGYVRVSTDDQQTSLDVQQERIGDYCRLHGLQLIACLVESDVSGKTQLFNRPIGKRIVEYIADGCSNIVAMKLDRLFRNAADALTMTEQWQVQGVALHLVDMGGTSLNTSSAIGRMMLTMLSGFAEFERSMIAERTTSALRHMKANGQVYGSIPYGKHATADGRLIDDATEQSIIAEMVTRRNEGMSYQRIANHLEESKVPTKNGGTWASTTIKRILGS